MSSVPAATAPSRTHRLDATPPYNLRRTLACGQAFRWQWDGNTAYGVFAGRAVHLAQTADGIVAQGLDGPALRRLRRYLGLDEPLGEIEAALGRDPVLRRLLPKTTGIAILRQDPWECLVSFIVSAFNNIPKIELTLDRLSRAFGEPVSLTQWSFPTPQRLADATRAQLRRCVLGYRAPYVQSVARKVADGAFDLGVPGKLPYGEARALLLELPGVGEKVADCVLLFAYRHLEAFPVDVWVKRAVERQYFGGRTRTEREIRAFARERFGLLAGYAQQHLFYYARTATSTRRV